MADQFNNGVATPTNYAPPKLDFSTLGDLPKTYYDDQAMKDQLAARRVFRNGIPKDAGGQPDYGQMADKLASVGAPVSDFLPVMTTGARIGLARDNANAMDGTVPPNAGAGTGIGPQSSNTGGTGGGTYESALQGAEGSDKNPNSSADLPYQFLDGTWTQVRNAHPELQLPPTKYDATPDQLKAAFGAFTQDNTAVLQKNGVPISARTQYLAHFLGAQGAVNFVSGMRQNPNAPAYQFAQPAAVKANQSVFFNKDGTAKTASQVFGQMTSRFAGVAPYGGAQAPQVAQAGDGDAAPATGTEQPAAAAAAAAGPSGVQVAGPAMAQGAPARQPDMVGNPQQSADEQFPSASQLVPPAWRNNPGAYAAMLEKRATLTAAIDPKQAELMATRAKTISEAIQKDREPPPAVREYQTGRNPGETLPGYQARTAGMAEDAKEDAKAANKMLDDATAMGIAAQNGQSKVQWLKTTVNQPGFYSGPLSAQVKTFQQWRQIFGGPPSAAVPQEAFDKVVNDMLTEQIKAMGKSGVGRVLLAEVQNMRNSIASNGITPMSNRALLELTNRVYQQQKDLGEIVNRTPHSRAAIQQAESNYYRNHPLINDQEKANPMWLGAPDAPANIKDPVAARAWAQSIGLKPGDPIRFNGKYVAVP